MKKCTSCKLDFEYSYFAKFNDFKAEPDEVCQYYKLCYYCRIKGRAANQRRKEAKSNQSKEHYENNKKEIGLKNREWREKNKDKLKEYEKSPQRKHKNKLWREKKREEDRYRFVWYAAKRRAKLNNIPFTITKQDIINICPKDNKCPILGITLQFGNKISQDNSPSLDRIIPSLGYVQGNILLISYRANRIKNDSTLDELEKICSFIKNLEINNG